MADEPSEAEALVSLVAYFAERLNLVFAYFYCMNEFEEDEDFTANPSTNGRAWGLQTIRSACLHTTLVALRDLNDVFLPRSSKARPSRPSDFRISDFGYPKSLSFLADAERNRINQEIAHATLPGSKTLARPWDMFELATKGIRQSLEFLEWAEKHFTSEKNVAAGYTALFCRTRTQKTYDYFATAIDKRRQKNSHGKTQNRVVSPLKNPQP